jgi:hypothetical protein
MVTDWESRWDSTLRTKLSERLTKTPHVRTLRTSDGQLLQDRSAPKEYRLDRLGAVGGTPLRAL